MNAAKRLGGMALALAAWGAEPFLTSELIFEPEKWHNHSSSVVELPGGDLFAVWYHGSGERRADDVVIECSRRERGRRTWLPRRTLADTPQFPDCNPALFVDSRARLWLLWPVILANEWHTALMKYRISTDYQDRGRLPRWEVSENMLFIPRNFAAKAREGIGQLRERLHPAAGSREAAYLAELERRAEDKYFSRLGWMPRVHPIELPSGRILVPLYSDGYDFSLIAVTDDGGLSWTTSEPLVGPGNVQPSLVRARDGRIVAFMRDNGPAPKRIQVAESRDDGVTWSAVRDSDLPNPGAGIEAVVLSGGLWALIYNDTEKDRHSLAVSLSEDEGRSWKWTRRLEQTPGGSFHYPSLIQARDGSLHATYSHFTAAGKTIKHAHFNVEWVQQGEER